MTEFEFYALVERMRQAQKDYFNERHANALETAKGLERAVDSAIKEYKLAPTMNLFEEVKP
jgi:hypothetical protein